MITDAEDFYFQDDGSASLSTGSTRTPSPSTEDLQPQNKKIRKNHNEFERRRRDAQRQRLDELRQAVPGLDPKASMVAVLEAARVYIDELRARSARLEGVGSAIPSPFPSYGSSPANPPILVNGASYQATATTNQHILPAIQQHQQPQLVRKISSDSDEDGTAFKKGRAQLVDKLPPVSAFAPPESTIFSAPMRRSSPVLPRASASGSQFPNMARPSLLASVIQESFTSSTTKHRKDSGLLLPTDNPETFYFGHRDSMQNLLAVPLPMILDEKSHAYVKCVKCQRGVDGLVMIDCDVCRKWYHIRCVSIDATSIPVRWSCPECPCPSHNHTQH